MKKIKASPYPTETPTDFPSPAIKELMKAITSLKDEKEATNFFRDLLTMPEMKEFANRWQIVKRLMNHEPYLAIAQALNVSTTTVTRVAMWLHNGMGGYKSVAHRVFGHSKKS